MKQQIIKDEIEKILDVLSNENEVKSILEELDDSAENIYRNFSDENIIYFYSKYASSKEEFKVKFIRLLAEKIDK